MAFVGASDTEDSTCAAPLMAWRTLPFHVHRSAANVLKQASLTVASDNVALPSMAAGLRLLGSPSRRQCRDTVTGDDGIRWKWTDVAKQTGLAGKQETAEFEDGEANWCAVAAAAAAAAAAAGVAVVVVVVVAAAAGDEASLLSVSCAEVDEVVGTEVAASLGVVRLVGSETNSGQ
nr:hypothetical protein CFP56_36465 [Quercus suber]